MLRLLIELGIEELPSSYMKELQATLQESFRSFLKEHRLNYEAFELLMTPRRMVFHVQGLADMQEEVVQKLKGPPVKIAFDNNGQPGQALKGFLAKCGTTQWHQEATDQGAYIFAEVKLDCLHTADFFQQQFPVFIQQFPFKKTMRWSGYSFIRPLRWICSFVDDALLPLQLFGVHSAPMTRLLHGDANLAVKGPDSYFESLRKEGIVLCTQERKRIILDHLPFSPEESLLEENAQRTEDPKVLCASYPQRFSHLPAEVIHTVISEQMKCFSDKSASLNPASQEFYLVMNGNKEADLVRRGFEKVVSARLNDAAYFYEQDLLMPLSQRKDDLRHMVFMEKMGTVYEKVARIKEAIKHLELDADYPELSRLADFMKNDLSTRLVAELPSLQGIMGRIYAQQEHLPLSVAQAIEEHYFPRQEGDNLPDNPLAVIIGAIDRADSLAGASIKGILFSGSSDPFGLRRSLNGLIRLFLYKDLPFSPEILFNACWRAYSESSSEDIQTAENYSKQVAEWFSQRLTAFLSLQFRYDLVQATASHPMNNTKSILCHLDLLHEAFVSPDFRKLCESYSRIDRLLKDFLPSSPVDSDLFEENEEKVLFEGLRDIDQAMKEFLVLNKEGMDILYKLNDPVQRFFDKVFVMSERSEIKTNRLHLIFEVRNLIGRFFDLSKIVFEGGSEQ